MPIIDRTTYDTLDPSTQATYDTIRENAGFYRDRVTGLVRWSLNVHPHRPQDFRTFNGGHPYPLSAFPSELADFQSRFVDAMNRTDWPAPDAGRTLPEQCWQTESFKSMAAWLSAGGFTISRAEIPESYRTSFGDFLAHGMPGLLTGG